jgi:hypothetical protein
MARSCDAFAARALAAFTFGPCDSGERFVDFFIGHLIETGCQRHHALQRDLLVMDFVI